MYNIDYEIKPVFKVDEQICKDFERVELLCDDYLGNIYSDVYRQDCCLHHIENNQEENAFAFAAYHQDQMIGFADGYAENGVMNLDSLFVDPKYHGSGVGAKLLKTTEDAISIISSSLQLCPLTSAVGFYQQYKYNFVSGKMFMIKKLPKTITGVVPVFEWCDELQAKLNVKIDTSLLTSYKHQPMFVYIGKNNCIDGVALRLPNGEQYIKLDSKQKSLAKYRKIELSWALDNCR